MVVGTWIWYSQDGKVSRSVVVWSPGTPQSQGDHPEQGRREARADRVYPDHRNPSQG